MRFFWLVMYQFLKIHRMKGEKKNCSKKGQQVFPDSHAYLRDWLQTRMVRNLGVWAQLASHLYHTAFKNSPPERKDCSDS